MLAGNTLSLFCSSVEKKKVVSNIILLTKFSPSEKIDS